MQLNSNDVILVFNFAVLPHMQQGPILAIGTGLYLETSKVAQEKLKEYLSVSQFYQPEHSQENV